DVLHDVASGIARIVPEPHEPADVVGHGFGRHVEARSHAGVVRADRKASGCHGLGDHEGGSLLDDRRKDGDVATGEEVAKKMMLEIPGEDDLVDQIGTCGSLEVSIEHVASFQIV